MNKKSLVVILGVIVIALIGVAVYFATTNKASQPVCGKLSQFSNESWANNLNTLYKSDFLKDSGGNLWYESGMPTMAGELSSCKINDLFVFIPEYFEFGCGTILKYDIENNKLAVSVPGFCASRFGQVTDTYVGLLPNVWVN